MFCKKPLFFKIKFQGWLRWKWEIFLKSCSTIRLLSQQYVPTFPLVLYLIYFKWNFQTVRGKIQKRHNMWDFARCFISFDVLWVCHTCFRKNIKISFGVCTFFMLGFNVACDVEGSVGVEAFRSSYFWSQIFFSLEGLN
jgi:hypothetical protein